MIPTRVQFQKIINIAENSAELAGKIKFNELKKLAPPGYMLDECGGAYLILSVDSRTKMGKFFKSLIEDPLPNVEVSKAIYYGGFSLRLLRVSSYRERRVEIAKKKAALKVIMDSLDIRGHVFDYID